MIWALCWRSDRPQHRHRIQHPHNCSWRSGDGHGTCEAHPDPLCDVCESFCHKFGEDYPDSYLVVWGNPHDWSSPEKLRPSMFQHFSSKWIISQIVSITDILHQALTKITCSRAAMVYPCKSSIDNIYRCWTISPTDVWKTEPWLLPKDRLRCPTNFHEVSSKFPAGLIVVLMINIGVQVSICSNRNCVYYPPDILLWHTTHGNER